MNWPCRHTLASPRTVVGGEPRKTHRRRPSLCPPGAKSVVFADSARNDRLEIHPNILEEMLRQIAAVEADGFVRIFAVIVVPVQQRAGRSDASANAYMLTVPQMSTSQALGIRSLLIMLIIVQGTTPKYSSIEVQHCTALMVTSAAFIHCSITAPSFAILISAGFRNAARSKRIFDLMRASLARRVVVLQLRDAPENFGKSSVSTEMPLDSEQLLAVADGVECRRPRADAANAQVPQAVHHPADAGEPCQILLKIFGVRR